MFFICGIGFYSYEKKRNDPPNPTKKRRNEKTEPLGIERVEPDDNDDGHIRTEIIAPLKQDIGGKVVIEKAIVVYEDQTYVGGEAGDVRRCG